MAQTVTAPSPSKPSDRTPEPVGERILVRAFPTYRDAKRGGRTAAGRAHPGPRLSRDPGALPEASNVDVSRYDVLVERRDAEKAFQLLGD